MPRRLPIYKGEARTYGEEDANPDPNKGGLFNNYNRNKLGVTINMRSPKGRALADRLIASSSVVTENFAPGRDGALGPDLRAAARAVAAGDLRADERLRTLGPACRAPQLLARSSRRSAGSPTSRACRARSPPAGGCRTWTTRRRSSTPRPCSTAIYHRNLTGRGRRDRRLGVEAGINLLGPDPAGRGGERPLDPRRRLPDRQPAGASGRAPHGVYPCAGEDRWIAIAVFDDAEWRGLVSVMGTPAWASEARFATQASRFANQDALDARWPPGRRTRTATS
jgi:crotonobetainyl-CoA:carnitine CoA-transferase CaiB-like acyl-CoA transferase